MICIMVVYYRGIYKRLVIFCWSRYMRFGSNQLLGRLIPRISTWMLPYISGIGCSGITFGVLVFI